MAETEIRHGDDADDDALTSADTEKRHDGEYPGMTDTDSIRHGDETLGDDADDAAEDTEGDEGSDAATATNDTGAAPESPTKLRRQAASYRRRLRAVETRAEELAADLWTERVAALGILADPSDLPYDADRLDSPDEIRAAAEELVAAKPHLRARTLPTMPAPAAGAAEISLMGLLGAR